jgi:uncharacterized protein YcbK (DUF882 family)
LNEQLTPNFTLDEFRCPCCGDVIEVAARALAERLQPVRDNYGPINISSGYRCQKHNQIVGGRPFSQHLCGLAADIACSGDADRFQLISLLLDYNFKRIGIGKLIIHADIGTITGPVIWVY